MREMALWLKPATPGSLLAREEVAPIQPEAQKPGGWFVAPLPTSEGNTPHVWLPCECQPPFYGPAKTPASLDPIEKCWRAVWDSNPRPAD